MLCLRAVICFAVFAHGQSQCLSLVQTRVSRVSSEPEDTPPTNSTEGVLNSSEGILPTNSARPRALLISSEPDPEAWAADPWPEIEDETPPTNSAADSTLANSTADLPPVADDSANSIAGLSPTNSTSANSTADLPAANLMVDPPPASLEAIGESSRVSMALSAVGDASRLVTGAIEDFSKASMDLTPLATDALRTFSVSLKAINDSVTEYSAREYPGFEKIAEWCDSFIEDIATDMSALRETLSQDVGDLVEDLATRKRDISVNAEEATLALTRAREYIELPQEKKEGGFNSQELIWGQSLLQRSRRRPSLQEAKVSMKNVFGHVFGHHEGPANCQKATQAVAQVNQTVAILVATMEPLGTTASTASLNMIGNANKGILKISSTVADALAVQYIEKDDRLKSSLSMGMDTLKTALSSSIDQTAVLSSFGTKVKVAQDSLSPLRDALDKWSYAAAHCMDDPAGLPDLGKVSGSEDAGATTSFNPLAGLPDVPILGKAGGSEDAGATTSFNPLAGLPDVPILGKVDGSEDAGTSTTGEGAPEIWSDSDIDDSNAPVPGSSSPLSASIALFLSFSAYLFA